METIFKRGDVIKNCTIPGKTFIVDSLVVKSPVLGAIATEALESAIHQVQVHDRFANPFDFDPKYCSHVDEDEKTLKIETKKDSDHAWKCRVGNHEESKTAISLAEKHFKQWIVCKHCGEAIRPLVSAKKAVKIEWGGL